MLGLIPGVGAVYNGQYVKGLIHVMVLGALISLVSSSAGDQFEAMFGMLIGVWFFYMVFEAYHTASRRLRGLPVDEFSSLIPLQNQQASSIAGPVVLILLGGLFLVMTVWPEWVHDVIRWWPLLLIVAGVYLLLIRVQSRSRGAIAPGEDSSERR
jgi:hypothetical protein